MKIFIAIIFFLLILSGCSDGTVSPEPNEPTDTISGIYFLQGTKIEHTYDFPWPSWGGEEVINTADTSNIAFTTQIRFFKDRYGEKTLQFYGLEGLNAGENAIFPPDCSTYAPSTCGHLKFNNSTFEFDLFGSAGSFTGTGTLNEGLMSLNTKYEYRPTGIYYDLTGMKVEEL